MTKGLFRYLFIAILVFSGAHLFAQVPHAIQADFLVRTFNGDIVTNQQVNILVNILKDSPTGQAIYFESHAKNTDRFGMLSIEIGNGTDVTGDFSSIDWSSGNFYIKMVQAGGTNLMLPPTYKLNAVPYAFYAERAQIVDDADADPVNEIQELSLDNNILYLSKDGGLVDLNLADNQTLSYHDNKLYISHGNNVELPFNFSDTSAYNEIQELSRENNTISLSLGGGSFIDENTTYTAGNGIRINETTIENTAPSQWSTLTGGIAFNNGGVVIGSGNPEPSAALKIGSENKGFLPPKMSTQQRNSIANPTSGLIIFNSETNCINFFNGMNWIEICGTCTPQPSIADAGEDKPDVSGSNVQLNANSPKIGEGKWTIVQGDNGSFSDASNPKSTFTGQSGITYILEWSINNDCGISTDQVVISFWSCGYPLTDLRDGQSYNTVKIGNQCWMAENLNYGNMITGASDQADNGIPEKYCYDDNAGNCDNYGGLYQWDEMLQYGGSAGPNDICPPNGGWRVPSDSDWNDMAVHLGITADQANKTGLRGVDQGTQLKKDGNTGFEALFGGLRLNNGIFYAINNYGNFWSYNAEGNKAWRHAVSANTTGIFRTLNDKKEALSIRCIKGN